MSGANQARNPSPVTLRLMKAPEPDTLSPRERAFESIRVFLVPHIGARSLKRRDFALPAQIRAITYLSDRGLKCHRNS